MAILLSLLPAVGHDQLWCLYVAQQILHGTKLYGPQLLESNPPLIMAMLTIPAALSNLLHIPITFLFKLAVLLTEVVSALSSFYILRRAKILLTPARLWSLACAFITIFTVLPARDLGQRDHLLAILCLPYVLSAALDSNSCRNSSSSSASLTLLFRLLIGVLAGLGICLKPHHILIPIAIELYFLVQTRSIRHLLRTTFLAIVATGVAFFAAIRLLTPAYLTDVVPLLKDVYWAIGHLTLPQLVNESLQLHILAALCVALYLYLKPTSPLALLLILSGAASTIAYYLQGTGWYYQQIPAISFFACALWLLLMKFATQRNLTTPNWMPKAALALTVLSFALTAHFSGYTLSHPFSYPSGLSDIPDPSFFANLPPNTPIAILSTVVDDTVPPSPPITSSWPSAPTTSGCSPPSCAMKMQPAIAPPHHRSTSSLLPAWPNWTASSTNGWSKTSTVGTHPSSSSSAAKTPPSSARSSKTATTTSSPGSNVTPLSEPPSPPTNSNAPPAPTTPTS